MTQPENTGPQDDPNMAFPEPDIEPDEEDLPPLSDDDLARFDADTGQA